jgi:hypothetical protein
MPFAPGMVTNVLNDNFEDAKVLFLSPLMAIEYAHLVMLNTQRIISSKDAPLLRKALDSISLTDVRRAYDGSYEDLFFYIDRLVAASLVVTASPRPAPHGPQPQRHRHDDVRCAARVHSQSRARDTGPSAIAAGSGQRGIATRSLPFTPTPSAPSRRRLPIISSRSSNNSNATPSG